MAEFKVVISDPKAKKAYQMEIKSPDADRLVGKKVGEVIKGELLNLAGFEFKITGGSDKQGFPMRVDVMGTKRIRPLLSSGPGIKITSKGQRKRKSVRGNQIADDIAQINLKVVKEGSKPVGVVLGKEESSEKKEEDKGAKEEGTQTEKGNEEPKE